MSSSPRVISDPSPVRKSLKNTYIFAKILEDFLDGSLCSATGDPKGGKTRVVTNNDCNHGATNMGTPIYYMGTQENGGKFTDAAGKMEFDGPGEIGMLDWCAPDT